MAVLFSDDFNRADSATVDATNWQEVLSADWSIASNRAQAASALSTGPAVLLTTASAHVATADVKVTATQVAAGADGGPVARWVAGSSGSIARGYAVDCYPATIEIYRHDTASSGTLLRTVAITQVANGVIRLEVSGLAPFVLLRMFYNGVQQGADVNDGSAVTGSTGRVLAAGRTGIYAWNSGAARDYDDFLAEDFPVPVPVGIYRRMPHSQRAG